MWSYLKYEGEVWTLAWRRTAAIFSFKFKHIPINLGVAIFGLAALWIIAGISMVGEEIIVATSALAGVGLVFIFVFVWQLASAPYKLWKDQQAQIRKLSQKSKRIALRLIPLTVKGYSEPSNGLIRSLLLIKIVNSDSKTVSILDWRTEFELATGEPKPSVCSGIIGEDEDEIVPGLTLAELKRKLIIERADKGIKPGRSIVGYLPFVIESEKSFSSEELQGAKLTVHCLDAFGGPHTCVFKFGGPSDDKFYVPGLDEFK